MSIGKLLAFLGDALAGLDQCTVIGEMILHDDGKPNNIVFRLNKNFCDIDDFSLDFTVKKTVKEDNMYVINSIHNETAVEGKVDSEYFITPMITSTYLAFKQNQSQRRQMETNTSEVIHYVSEGRRNEKSGSLRELDFLARKRKKMLQDKKRERLGKTEVLDIVFNAFEKYSSIYQSLN